MHAVRRLGLVVMVALLSVPAARAQGPSASDPTETALMRVLTTANGNVITRESPQTGRLAWIRATDKAVLERDDPTLSPRGRALAFLQRDGALIGMTASERAHPESVLRFSRIDTDVTGKQHVRFDQTYRGIPVFGAQILVHMIRDGITGVNGNFIPDVSMSTTPRTSARAAGDTALALARKVAPAGVEISVESSKPMIYRTGLIEGQPGKNVLTWSVVVDGIGVREQIFIDAIMGVMVRRVPLVAGAKDRVAYSPQYVRQDPNLFALRREGEPPTNIPPVDNLYDFTGQVWDFFHNSFGRDSFDGHGKTMRTVYLVNQACPNAYWNSSTTNYCPGFDDDDVVAHEWGHAYTEYTQGLIYSCQSGALNESYSDIWGETIDLLNGRDGAGGSNNDQPYPAGVRWQVGEDLAQNYQETAYGKSGGVVPDILRDMWDPEASGNPGRTSQSLYVCNIASDQGGVHANSGVPNHAYAMLVDGKEYNNIRIRGIGLTKAAHIYYQAMTAYQTPSSNFADHEQALLASCNDLLGTDLKELFTGAASGKIINADDCRQVERAARAVELSKPVTQCKFQPLLKPGAPEVCPGATKVYSEDWERGLDGWTKETHGATLDWSKTQWDITSKLPKGHSGRAAFALDPNNGTCQTGGDNSGSFNIDSPEIKIPAKADRLKMRFDHWVGTEHGADGGNVMVSVNGAAFAAVSASNYVYNAPNVTLAAPTPDPTTANKGNPKVGQAVWSGADGGETRGSWGTTVAELGSLVKPGDTIRLRLDFGVDCASGAFGWYVDNILLYDCPDLPGPEIKPLGFSGRVSKPVTIAWSRPAGAVGPDTVQESNICAPLVKDDAESGLGLWDVTHEGIGVIDWQISDRKPQHTGNSFWASALEGMTNVSAIMTYKEPLKIGGPTTLSFSDWFVNEGDDSVRVEASTDHGKKWEPVYQESRFDYAPLAAADFELDKMTPRSADLSSYAGKTIQLRFRFVAGPDDRAGSTPFGWYVDDISLLSYSWHDVATVAGTSYRIASHAAGVGCFRVNTTYRIQGRAAESDFGKPSGAVTFAKFSTSVLGAHYTKPPAGTLPSTGLGVAVLPAMLALTAAGGLAWTLRRRRSS